MPPTRLSILSATALSATLLSLTAGCGDDPFSDIDIEAPEVRFVEPQEFSTIDEFAVRLEIFVSDDQLVDSLKIFVDGAFYEGIGVGATTFRYQQYWMAGLWADADTVLIESWASDRAGNTARDSCYVFIDDALRSSPLPEHPVDHIFLEEDRAVALSVQAITGLDGGFLVYEFEAARDSVFATPVFRTVGGHQVDVPGPLAGRYFWRARLLDDAGRAGEWSRNCRFMVTEGRTALDGADELLVPSRITSLSDQGFIVTGSSIDGGSIVVRRDDRFGPLWSRELTGYAANNSFFSWTRIAPDAVRAADGGLFVTALDGSSVPYVLKLSSDGDEMTSMRLEWGFGELPVSLQTAPDGGVRILTHDSSTFGVDRLRKYSGDLAAEWTTDLGSVSSYTIAADPLGDGLACVGWSPRYRFDSGFEIKKFSGSGERDWRRVLFANSLICGARVTATPAGTYVAATIHAPENSARTVYLAGVDNDGGLLWENDISREGIDWDGNLFALASDRNGDVYFCGTSRQHPAPNALSMDIFVGKCSANGQLEWLRTAGNEDEHEAATALAVTTDTVIVLGLKWQPQESPYEFIRFDLDLYGDPTQ